jgi:hypothetical protein
LDGPLCFGMDAQSMFIMMSSMGCSVTCLFVSMAAWITSRAVLVAAQKNDGDSDHPIWRASGITSCTGSPGFPPRRMYAKFHASSAFTAILQYLSFKSAFENMNGVVSSFDRAIAQIICGMTFPNSNIACCEAFALSDASFTDTNRFPFSSNLNDRSRIILNFCDSCGIAAIGDIFSFGGRLSLMSSQYTSQQQPSATWSIASFLHAVAASSLFTLAWGPFVIAANNCL